MIAADLVAEIKARSDIIEVIGERVALRRQGGANFKGLCPFHAERTASFSVNADKQLFHCFGCGKSGDVIRFIQEFDGATFVQAITALAERAGVALDGNAARPPASRHLPPRSPVARPPARHRPPPGELAALWHACRPVDETQLQPAPEDLAASSFFAFRRWWPPLLASLGIARLTPLADAYSPWPAWWPKSWAGHVDARGRVSSAWRLAVLAYEPDGRAASLHARSICACPACDRYACLCDPKPPRREPKTRWPYDCDASGLLFADAGGHRLLTGARDAALAGVLITEGLTDFLAAAMDVRDMRAPFAVLGAASGGFGALARVAWPDALPAFVAVDTDTAGQQYAAEIRRALPPSVRLRRWSRAPRSP